MDGTKAFRKSAGSFANFERSPAYQALVPLRIPAGWKVAWNELQRDKSAENGDFGGSSVFMASNDGRRFLIDVEYRPEHEPDGHFRLLIDYQPWPRDDRGRRRNEVPFAFDADAQRVHLFETQSFEELIEQLETWIARCTVWTIEQN